MLIQFNGGIDAKDKFRDHIEQSEHRTINKTLQLISDSIYTSFAVVLTVAVTNCFACSKLLVVCENLQQHSLNDVNGSKELYVC